MTVAEKERARVVAFLRKGGDHDARGWFAWDSEMRGYAASFADRIERGDHLPTPDLSPKDVRHG